MKRMQAGFTMIELIVVIVILGVLAAVAMPKFDVSTEAKAAALQGVAGAATSAMNVNYGARKVNTSKGSAVTNCTDASTLMQGGLPTGYTITAAAIAADASVSCTLTQTSGGATTTFTGLGIL